MNNIRRTWHTASPICLVGSCCQQLSNCCAAMLCTWVGIRFGILPYSDFHMVTYTTVSVSALHCCTPTPLRQSHSNRIGTKRTCQDAGSRMFTLQRFASASKCTHSAIAPASSTPYGPTRAAAPAVQRQSQQMQTWQPACPPGLHALLSCLDTLWLPS